MDEKLLFCVSVRAGERVLYEAEWRETERGRTLIDLLVEVCGNKIIGQDLQVLVSKERSFLEAAVIQVCTPLEELADKSQSYIQYVLKLNDKIKKNFPLNAAKYHAERDIFKSNLSSDGRHTISSDHAQIMRDWRDSYASKTFCIDQQFSIDPKKSENWTTQFQEGNGQLRSSFVDMTVEEICKEIKRIKTTEPLHNKLNEWMGENVLKKEDVDFKELIAKTKKLSSESSTNEKHPTTRSRNNSVSDEKKQTGSTNKQIKTNTKKNVSNNHISSKNISSRRNSIESQTPKRSITDRSNKSSLDRNSKRTPSMDRLSALAQPRKSYISTNNKRSVTTARKKTPPLKENKIKERKAVTSKTKNFNLNATFVQSNVNQADNNKVIKKSKDNFFVEIFTNNEHKESTSDKKNKKEIENKKLTTPETTYDIKSPSCESLEKPFTKALTSHSNETTRKVEHLQNFSNPIQNNENEHFVRMEPPPISSQTEINHFVGDQMDNLLFDLLGTDDIKSSLDSLIEDDLHRLAQKFSFTSSEDEDVVFLKSPQKEIVKGFCINEEKYLSEGKTDSINNDVNVTTDGNIDEICGEMWANSRGIKFFSGHTKQHVENETESCETENENTVTPHSTNHERHQTEDDHNVEYQNDVITEEHDVITVSDKHRKHWGNKIEGMDSMLVASLQAFSSDLRKNSEHVATNIRILYENWRENYENLVGDAMEQNTDPIPLMSNESTLDENQGPEEVNQQKAMAQIFRNLRKMEVIMKTIEQAAVTMVTVLKENAEKEKREEDEERHCSNLHRTKSFKWTELETAAKKQTRPKKWLHHKYRDDDDSDSDQN